MTLRVKIKSALYSPQRGRPWSSGSWWRCRSWWGSLQTQSGRRAPPCASASCCCRSWPSSTWVGRRGRRPPGAPSWAAGRGSREGRKRLPAAPSCAARAPSEGALRGAKSFSQPPLFRLYGVEGGRRQRRRRLLCARSPAPRVAPTAGTAADSRSLHLRHHRRSCIALKPARPPASHPPWIKTGTVTNMTSQNYQVPSLRDDAKHPPQTTL